MSKNDKKMARFAGYFASPLRYPGGKGRLGPWIASVLEANGLRGGCYVEPYAGGAGAALYLLLEGHVEHVVINDADPVICAFWKSVLENTSDLIALVERTDVTMERRSSMLSILEDPVGKSDLELGFAAFFLNRTSRSGILTGGVVGGKAQAGKYKLDARFNKGELISRLEQISAHKNHITVLGMDALELLETCGPHLPANTLVYLDPPYYVKGAQLYRNHYDHDDHKAIANYVRSSKHPLLVTYDNTEAIRKLYRGVPSKTFSLQYSTHLSRPRTTEILLYRNLQLLSSPELTRGRTLPARHVRRPVHD